MIFLLKEEQNNAIGNPPTNVFRPHDEHHFCQELRQQELQDAHTLLPHHLLNLQLHFEIKSKSQMRD